MRCATTGTNHVSTVVAKTVFICSGKTGCAMMPKAFVIASVRTVFITMSKKAVDMIQVVSRAMNTVCVSTLPMGPKRTMVAI
jgi:hypothetical protein